MSNSAPETTPSQPSFLAALLDTKFQSWITLRVAGILYVIGIVAWAIIALVLAIGIGRAVGGPGGVVVFILAFPLLTFVAVLILRLIFESSIALVAIARNTDKAG